MAHKGSEPCESKMILTFISIQTHQVYLIDVIRFYIENGKSISSIGDRALKRTIQAVRCKNILMIDLNREFQ